MLAALAIACVFQNPLDQTLSFTHEGDTVTKITRALEKQTGLKMTAGPSLHRETLVIRVENWTLRKTLDEITRALHAEWKETEEGILLARSEKQEREQIAEEKKLRLAAVKKWQDHPLPGPWTEDKARQIVAQSEAIAQKTDPRRTDPQAMQQMRDLGKQTPDHRASYLARKRADVSALAEARPGRRIVLSSRPNSLQKLLPGAESVLATYMKEHASFYPLAQASLARIPEAMNTRDVRVWSGRKDVAPDRIIFTAYDLPYTPTIAIRSYLVSGHTIISMTSEAANLFPDDRKPLPNVKFEPPKEAQEFYRAFIDRKREPLGPKIQGHSDPLSWMLGPTLIEYAKALEKSLVAVIPDAAAEAVAFRGPTKDGLGYLAGIDPWCRWEERDGTLIIVPRLPAAARASFVDRARFFEFVDGARQAKKLTFEAAADYLKNQLVELPMERLHGAAVLEACDAYHFGMLDIWTSPVLRFWGRLAPAQRLGRTTVGALPGPGRTALHEWLFSTTIALQGTTIDPNNPDDGMDIRRLEPSELFPNGLPSDLELSSSLSEVPIFWFDAGGVGSERLEHAGSFATVLNDPTYKFAVNQNRCLKIALGSGSAKRETELDEPHRSEGLKWTSGKDLDPAIANRLREQYEKEKQAAPPVRRNPPPSRE